MTYKEMEETQEVKRKELLTKMRKIGCYPITQHPDYENDSAFDVDDIIEFVEKLKEQNKQK